MKVLNRQQVIDFTQYVTNQLGHLLLKHNINKHVSTFIGVDTKKHTPIKNQIDIAAEQIDALVDICYYILNHMTKEQQGLVIEDGKRYMSSDVDLLHHWFEMVYDFTAGTDSFFQQDSDEQSRIEFITQMVLSEVWELCDTVTGSSEETRDLILAAMQNVSSLAHSEPLTLILEKCTLTSKDMELDINAVFNLVHQANMNKRDPVTKKFEKRADGKILKPKGWSPPNIKAEIQRQLLMARMA